MKKIISFLLALLAAVGKECYQTFALGLVGGRDRRLVARLRALALDGPARRDPCRPDSRASRR